MENNNENINNEEVTKVDATPAVEVQEEEAPDVSVSEPSKENLPDEVKEEEKENSVEEGVESSITEEDKQEEPSKEEQNKQEEEAPTEEEEQDKEEEKEQEETTTPVEESPADEEALKKEIELNELKTRLAEFEEEKEIRTKVSEFVEFKNAAEQEFDDFCVNLQNSVNQEFAKYHLDTSKTLEELPEGERNIAIDIINRAMALRQQKAMITAQAVDTQYHNVVFTKAEKVFNKFDMTNEQAEVAAQTFVNIVKHTGIQDLGDDLVEKVKLSVAKALMDVPKEGKADDAPETMQEAMEQANEMVEESIEEVKEEAAKEIEVEPPTEEEPPKADITGYMDGITSTVSSSGVEVLNEDNVLKKLAELPHRERTAFYKENYDLIERAARKESARRSANKGSM